MSNVIPFRPERTIVIEYIRPPIPQRVFDFQASFDDDEPDDNGHMTVGFGKTPLAAMIDLIDVALWEAD